MIRVDTKDHIRELYFKEGKSIRAINRKLNVARKTVRGTGRCRTDQVPLDQRQA
ncbi:MAG: hypothetical protein ACOY9Y_04725 [Bacillota bacterium]